MILRFSLNLFEQEDEIQRTVVKVILELLDNKFFWDIANLNELFLSSDENTLTMPFDKKYISDVDEEKLMERIEEIYKTSAYITKTHQHYLTTIEIGMDINRGEIHPDNAYRIITERSLVIVENSDSDWNFVKGIVEKYKDFGNRKSIYQLIKESLDNFNLHPSNAGGIGEIEKRIEELKSGVYQDIHEYKLIAIFDSDRENADNINKSNAKLIKYLKNIDKATILNKNDIVHNKGDIIIWHMLHKKTIENYLPLNVIKNTIDDLMDQEIQNLDGLHGNPEKVDFAKYKDLLIRLDKKECAKKFLTDFSPQELENRCSHHKVSIPLPDGGTELVSEIEQILLKIAKII
jgi:hypothetical protein